jgi:hypothetical protein
MNYYHALFIKVITHDTYLRNEHVEAIVKEHFFRIGTYYNNIPIFWKCVEWEFPKNQFDSGNIITSSPISVDTYVMFAVKQTLNKIDNILKLSGAMNANEIIIFEITKPMVTSTLVRDSFGLIK